MNPEKFINEIVESAEFENAMCMRIHFPNAIGYYCSMRQSIKIIDKFLIPFCNYVKEQIEEKSACIDDLFNYMNKDHNNWPLYLACTLLRRKPELSYEDFLTKISDYLIISPFVDEIDLNIFSLIVAAFILDNYLPSKIDIRRIIGTEKFIYPTNKYCLTKVNGATFKKDGLIFNGKGYLYNYFTNKSLINVYDESVGFAKIIQDEIPDCDILYRIDEKLAIPAEDYCDYSGMAFEKFRGPNFNFNDSSLNRIKTIIVHFDPNSMNKLLMVVKREHDIDTGEELWHIEIETLPCIKKPYSFTITTFLHGIYYPCRNVFTHIDYTKNQYDEEIYLQKYNDSNSDIPIDQYTDSKQLHYKIWCIENGEFSTETWYKLMIISLPNEYQCLLNEILSK